jgi:hypothetical protein
MSLPDFLLEASRVLIGLALAVFVGVPLARRKIFLEGEEGKGLDRARFVASGAILVGVLLETQVLGSSLPPRHVWRAGVLFVLVASLVSSVMVIQPRARYYDERSLTLEENLRAPWHARRDAARARGSRIDFFGFLLALLALVLG